MPGRTYRFGDFTLSTLARELGRGDVPIPLSPRAFDCLVHLIENRERAVGKDELVAAIWGRPNVSDTQLGQAVLRARRAIGDDGQVQQFIRTVPRYGYRWVGQVEVVEPVEAEPVLAIVGAAPDETIVIGTQSGATTESPDRETASPPVGALQPHTENGRHRVDEARKRKHVLGLAAGLAAVVVLAGALALRSFNHSVPAESTTAQARTTAIVLPLRIDADAGSAWLRLGAMDLVAEHLRAGGLVVPPSESTVALLQKNKDSDPVAVARALRDTAPNALLVRGDLQYAAGKWTAELQATTVDGAYVKVNASRADALDAAREAADRLLGRLGRARVADAPAAGGLQDRLQQAQAAMLANDLDAARAILVSDTRLAREEPQLGYRLAQVDFRAGKYARGEASLTDLLAEATADDPLFRARLFNARGGMRIRQDNYKGAASDYDAAVALLQGGSHAPELGLALTGRGVTHAMYHEFAEALADLGAARVLLDGAGDALAVARVDSNLGGLEMDRDRPAQALAYLDSAATQFERYGAINELMETLASLVSDNLALLRPDDALAASDRSWALAQRVADPNQRLTLTLDRVDAFLALGRLSAAGALLGTLPDTAPEANPFVARRLLTLRARLALAEGRAVDAANAARRALSLRTPSDDTGEGVAEIALVYQRASLAAAAVTDKAPAQAWVPLQARSTWPVQAILKAEWAAARGDRAEAARQFRSALDLAERRGVPADVGLVAASYGSWLLRQDRLQEAGEVIGRVSPWANRDFDCALLQVRLFSALRGTHAWSKALAQATTLAGERRIPDDLQRPPR